jgi:broad specificity phosphatase PhoE
LRDLNPDVILVSPLQRALETCSFIFPDLKVPRIVEPLLSETFKHSSDICRSVEIKKQEFPLFDFSPVDVEGEFWYIKNDSLENQARYFEALKEVQGDYYHEKARSIMDFMHRERVEEKPLNVRLRAQKIKERLREYRKTYKRIAIVSHFFTIRYICSE